MLRETRSEGEAMPEPETTNPLMRDLHLLAKKGALPTILRKCTEVRRLAFKAIGHDKLDREEALGVTGSFLVAVSDWRRQEPYVQAARDLIGLTDRSKEEQEEILCGIKKDNREGRLFLAADRLGYGSPKSAFNHEQDILDKLWKSVLDFSADPKAVQDWLQDLHLGSQSTTVTSIGSATDQQEDRKPPDAIDPNDLLGESLKLRRKLDPHKVAQALPRIQVIENILAAAGIPTKPDALPSVVAICGDAGAGKTVVTGQVYDALANNTEANVLVVPCEMVLTSPQHVDEFDSEFGHLVGTRIGLVSAVRLLAEGKASPVVVLLDTLDYLLNTTTRPSLVQLFTYLHEAGATVIFSCRWHDYKVMLRPEDVRFGPLAPYTRPPIDLPPLSDPEVVEITKNYLKYHGIRPPTGSDQFAADMLKLAADRIPLKNIITNPLLLIMLCDTFAARGTIPSDLTTTRLCTNYREEKISRSRKYPANTVIAHTKLKLWQEVASEMWRLSDKHIALDVPRTALPHDSHSIDAYEDLCSEGVLVLRTGLNSLRVGFIHQVVAEYSIAMYLRDHARNELDELLASLAREPTVRWYGWQIVRHLMAVADHREAEQLLDKLDLSQAPAFRSAVFGLVERWREGLLSRLASYEIFTDDLLEALTFVSDDGLPEALDILANIMRRKRPNEVSGAAAKAGLLFVRSPDLLQLQLTKLLQVLLGIQRGEWGPQKENPSYIDELLGSLLRPMVENSIKLPESVLVSARELVHGATPIGVRYVIRIHLAHDAPIEGKYDLLRKLLSHPKGNDVGEEALDLISSVVEWRLHQRVEDPDNRDSLAFDNCDPLAFLRGGGKISRRLRATAVARAANEHPQLREAIVESFLETADKEMSDRLLICLQEAGRRGGGDWIATVLITRRQPSTSAGIGRICGLLKTLAMTDNRTRYTLADWLAPLVTAESYGTVDAYLRLVFDDPARLECGIQHLAALPNRRQEAVVANFARELKLAEWHSIDVILAHLEETSAAQAALLRARLAGRSANTREEARQVLLDLVENPSSRAALQALHYLQLAAKEGQEWLVPDRLTRFAEHSRRSTRLGALKVLSRLVRNHSGESDDAVVRWLRAARTRKILKEKESVEETIALLELSHSYLRDGVGTARDALVAIGQLVDDVTELATETAFARPLLALLKTAVTHPNSKFRTRAVAWCLKTLDSLDLARAGDGLSFAQETLGKAVEQNNLKLEDLLKRSKKWPTVNLITVVRVIVSHDELHARSPLLEDILGWQVDDKVHQEIWRHRLRGSQE